jgi:hypothetical protein
MKSPTKEMSMRLIVLNVALVLASAILCFGQINASPFVVAQTLGKAHVNGSLSYWGKEPCSQSLHEFYPVAPALRNATTSGPVRKMLQEMFADDLKMQVTQEPDGTVRMFETDVPTDLLNIKIRHITFDVPGAHGPNLAIRVILSTPEVETFRKAHKIGPFSKTSLLPSDADRNNPSVSGSLDDVTVFQALDYIFKTFSGFWIYGNCPNGGKGNERDVYFWFYRTFPPPKQ